MVRSSLVETITITSAKTYEIQYRVTTTKTFNGLGFAAGFGGDEYYTQVKITQRM